MDIKLFPEIGGEDGIWIEYGEAGPMPTRMERVYRAVSRVLLPKLPPRIAPPPPVAIPVVTLPEPVVLPPVVIEEPLPVPEVLLPVEEIVEPVLLEPEPPPVVETPVEPSLAEPAPLGPSGPSVVLPPTTIFLALPTWRELLMLVRARISEDWRTFKLWVRTKWSGI